MEGWGGVQILFDDDVYDVSTLFVEEEFMLLVNLAVACADEILEQYPYESPRPRAPRITRVRYNFRESIQDPMELFRFSAQQIKKIARAMAEPRMHRTRLRDSFTLVEGLCVLCRRLCYPARWNDLCGLFGRSKSQLSRIFHYMLDMMLRKYVHLLQFNVGRITNKLREWAAAVSEACPNTYNTVVLFLDGTHRRTCRPRPATAVLPPGVTMNDIQQSQYDGRLHKHGHKYHALVSPVGLIVHAYGPVDGRRHDTTILRQSGLAESMNDLSVGGVDYVIYADSAYALTRNLQKPIHRPVPGTPDARLNTIMARARTVASECGYNCVTNTWQTIDFVRQQKMFWTRPADMYLVAILLTNMRLCLRGHNQMSEFFNLSGTCPTLENYLSGNWY